MSDNIQHLDLDDDAYLDAPKALRDYVKKLQRQNENLNSELTTAKGRIASQALGEVLSGQGFKNPKRVERDLLADGIDPLDESAVKGWLEEFADDYAKGAVQQQPETPAIPDEERQAYDGLNLNGEFRQPADMSKVEAVAAEAGSNVSPDDLVRMFREKGL